MALSLADVVPVSVAIFAFLLSAWAMHSSQYYISSATGTSAWPVPLNVKILGLGVAVAAYLYGKLPHWKVRSLPGPKPTWLVGNLIGILLEGGMPEALTKWRTMYGNVFKFYFGRRLIVVVTDVELVKEVTMKKFRVFHDRPQPPFVTKFNQLGLVFSKGADWASAKNALLPLFHKGMLTNFLAVMHQAVDELSGCLRLVPASTPLDMNELFHKLAMDVIGDVALGVRFGLLRDAHQLLSSTHMTMAAPPAPTTAVSFDTAAVNHNNASAMAPRLAGAGSSGGDLNRGRMMPPPADATEQSGAAETGPSGRQLYELLMESVRLSSFHASISMLFILICAPLGRAVRLILSYVPGTNDYLFRRNQVYGVRTFVQMCIARRREILDSGDGAPVVDPVTDGSTAPAPRSPAHRSDAHSAETGVAAGVKEGSAFNDALAPLPQQAVATAEPVPARDSMTFLLSAVNKETRQPFPMETVAALATELIGAGSDTTANTLAFALYCVSGAPEVEARVVAEVLREGRGPGVQISYADLETGFPYVECVIKEALRLYPPAAAMARVALEDTELGGHRIPAGTGVFVPAMAMNRDPLVYPNPDAFCPERFADDQDGGGKTKYAAQFNPFGMGPRMCLGHRMAMVEAMLVFIRLYQGFSFVRAPPTRSEVPLKVSHTVVSKPKNGVWMYVVPRDGPPSTS